VVIHAKQAEYLLKVISQEVYDSAMGVREAAMALNSYLNFPTTESAAQYVQNMEKTLWCMSATGFFKIDEMRKKVEKEVSELLKDKTPKELEGKHIAFIVDLAKNVTLELVDESQTKEIKADIGKVSMIPGNVIISSTVDVGPSYTASKRELVEHLTDKIVYNIYNNPNLLHFMVFASRLGHPIAQIRYSNPELGVKLGREFIQNITVIAMDIVNLPQNLKKLYNKIENDTIKFKEGGKMVSMEERKGFPLAGLWFAAVEPMRGNIIPNPILNKQLEETLEFLKIQIRDNYKVSLYDLTDVLSELEKSGYEIDFGKFKEFREDKGVDEQNLKR